MKYACTEERFLRDIADHQMTIIRDDGIHRHVRFKSPGTYCMHFDLITWPGYLCYTGDMGTYVFRRLDDMFAFFRTDRLSIHVRDGQTLAINPSYWGEKLESIDRSSGYKNFSLDKFREEVRHWLEREDASEAVLAEAEEKLLELDFDNGYEAYRAVGEFDCDGFRFTDFFEADLTDYSSRFIWCCYALAWGIKKYDELRTKPGL